MKTDDDGDEWALGPYLLILATAAMLILFISA
jgi:hypothetical protein